MAQVRTPETEQTASIAEKYRIGKQKAIKEERTEPKQPEMTRLASKHPKFSKLRKNWTNKILQFSRNKNSFLQRKKNCQKSKDGLREERKRIAGKKLMN